MATLYVDDGYVTSGYTQTGVTMIWGSSEIFVPKIAMIQVQSTPTEIWQLDIPAFKLTLGRLLEETDGMAFPDIFNHNPSVTVGGAVLAKVVEILEPYTVTFEDGQYAVNLTGANSNIGDRVNVNQVSVRSANSAGLQDLTSLQAASFGDGAVALSQATGIAGTIYPIGTKGTPSNNFADARSIVLHNNMSKILIIGSAVAGIGDNIGNLTIQGTNPLTSVLQVLPEAETLNVYVRDLFFTGVLDGNSVIRDCAVADVEYFSGFIEHCAMIGTATIKVNGDATFLNCSTSAAIAGSPTLDLTNATSVSIRNFDGHIRLINCDHACEVDASITGAIIIEPSVTDGTIHVHGECNIIHTQTGTEVIQDFTSATPSEAAEAVWANPTKEITSTLGLTTEQEAKLDAVLTNIADEHKTTRNTVLAN